MISTELKQKLAPWTAAAFCAILSLITISFNLRLSFQNHGETGTVDIVFFAFLPMCFLFVGATAAHMQLQIRELRKKLDEVRSKKAQ